MPQPTRSLVLVLTAATGLALLHRVFVTSTSGRAVDELAMVGAGALPQTWAGAVLGVVSVFSVGVALLGCVAVAPRRSTAVAALVLVGGAQATTQLLKAGLPGADGAGSLPSGHVTAAASVLAAVLLCVRPRTRPVVLALGVPAVTAVAAATVVAAWHRPSDAVAAVLVVLAWTAVVLLVVVPEPAVAVERAVRELLVGVALVGGLVAVSAVLAAGLGERGAALGGLAAVLAATCGGAAVLSAALAPARAPVALPRVAVRV